MFTTNPTTKYIGASRYYVSHRSARGLVCRVQGLGSSVSDSVYRAGGTSSLPGRSVHREVASKTQRVAEAEDTPNLQRMLML